jgi:large subunit ribosomal protein L3
VKGLLGVKLGMTQVFDESGIVTPVTIIQAGPCYVTQVKTVDSDGYDAVQVRFGDTKEKRLTGGQKGHLGLLKSNKKHPNRKTTDGLSAVRHLREFRTKEAAAYEVGQALTVEQFSEGDRVDVSGKTKGRGFAGVVKRHVQVVRIDADKNLLAIKGSIPGVKGGLVIIREASKG